jgi:ATP-binding cassette subfamily B protein
MNGGTGRTQIARSRRQLIVVVVGGLLSTLVSLALPATLGRAIDGGGIVLPVALVAVAVVCDLFDSFSTPAFVAGATARLRHRLIGQVLSVSPHRLQPFPTGDLVTRISGQAAEAAQATISRITLMFSIIPPVGSLVLLSIMDWRLGAAFLAGVGLVGLVLRSYSRRTVEVSAAYQRTQGRIAGRLTEALTGARTIAAAGTLGVERQRILTPLKVFN